MMITGISIVAVPVDDLDEALHFFCELLGMEKRKDLVGTDRYKGERYVEVAPPGSPVALSPYTNYDQPPGKATIGEYSRMVLRVANVGHAHSELTARGVQFETEPFDLAFGTFAAIRDPWGNIFGLTDSKAFKRLPQRTTTPSLLGMGERSAGRGAPAQVCHVDPELGAVAPVCARSGPLRWLTEHSANEEVAWT
jgi:catechol 2,3-dioxygenase-like lactoylglutathione lyase family enzyme